MPTSRDLVNNAEYFRLGGQIGVETKRGCNRQCSYCVDPLAKGPTVRLRLPAEVADEMESLLHQGIDVFPPLRRRVQPAARSCPERLR